MDGDFVEALETLRLSDAVVDHHRIDVFEIGNADELIDVGVISLITFECRIRRLPLLMGATEKRDIADAMGSDPTAEGVLRSA